MTKYRVETHSVLHVHNIDLKNLSQPQVFAHESAMFTLTQIQHFCSPNLLYTRLETVVVKLNILTIVSELELLFHKKFFQIYLLVPFL